MALESLPYDPEYVEVTIGDASFQQVADCDTGDGWILQDGGLQLCGTACDTFRESGHLETEWGCPPVG